MAIVPEDPWDVTQKENGLQNYPLDHSPVILVIEEIRMLLIQSLFIPLDFLIIISRLGRDTSNGVGVEIRHWRQLYWCLESAIPTTTPEFCVSENPSRHRHKHQFFWCHECPTRGFLVSENPTPTLTLIFFWCRDLTLAPISLWCRNSTLTPIFFWYWNLTLTPILFWCRDSTLTPEILVSGPSQLIPIVIYELRMCPRLW